VAGPRSGLRRRGLAEISARPLDPKDALNLDQLDHFPISPGNSLAVISKRVAIARAIAKRPDSLPREGPTGALDYDTGRVVLAAIDRANAELGTTHNAAIAGMANGVLRLARGRIVGIEHNTTRVRPEELNS
jgi:putative ABC transport system ATP-binding protein